MTGNRKVDILILVSSVLVSLGAIIGLLYARVAYQRPLPSDTAEKEQLLSDTRERNYIGNYKVDKLIINPYSRSTGRLRFLSVEMYFRPFHTDQVDYFKNHKAFIHDAIIDIVGHMTPEELNSLYGKILLENRIKRRVNALFSRPTLREVFFTRFVVQ